MKTGTCSGCGLLKILQSYEVTVHKENTDSRTEATILCGGN
jgi:hypothetical protein